ncbi:MAG: hypothetical protein WCJ55_15385 [Chloroflexales bacterium]
MSDVDPTPSSPITIGDRLAWWRGDLDARVAALEAKIDANHTATLVAIAALRGVNNATLSSLLTEDQFDTAGRLQTGVLNDIKALLTTGNVSTDAINAVLGGGIYSNTETGNIRALLLNLVYGQSRYGIMPDTGAAIPKKADVTISYFGRRYIIWSASFGTVTVGGADPIPFGATLANSVPWDGYSVYIQSDGPTFRLDDTASELPCNTWIPLAGSNSLTFSVEAQYNATGYMRVAAPPVYTFTSTIVTSAWYMVTDWTPLPTMGGVSSDTCTQNAYGWEVKHISGPQIRFMPYGGDNVILLLTPGMTTTFPGTINWRAGNRISWDGYNPVTFTMSPASVLPS